MPKPYLELKKKFKRKGMLDEAAKESAAKIYNAKIRKPGQPPVTRHGK